MSIKSMTGFARTEGVQDTVRWHWEIRSVNGRGLDLRLRLPPGFDAIEPKLRDLAQRKIARGSLNAALNLQREAGGTAIQLNEAVLAQVLKAADRACQMTGGSRPSVESLLAIRGVLEVADPQDTLSDDLAKALLATFDQALGQLIDARASEGARLAKVLQDQLAVIEQQVAIATASPTRGIETVRKRLAEQVQKLLDASTSLDPSRLHQEAALIATRIDIEEEIKRLAAHVAAARDLLAAAEPVGRKLDFLAQEFNREANTLCSKANDPDLTRAGLALKAVIDQLREQVQNIE